MTASVGDQVLVDAPLVELEPEPRTHERAGTATPLLGLPERVHIYEVGPRDGLQNEDTVVPVEVKAEFIRRLVDAGLEAVELTSFVPPSWIPQLGDAEELLGLLGPLPGRHPVPRPQRAWPGTRARRRGHRDRRLRQRHRERSPSAT